ncbi:HAD-IIB family hydrolase [Geomicrobium sp. JCM 19039]|uniref:HAD-IIB family hydrolase n=1 Tax=Geomicrobium sp. JCM 19039 TaxID=1460636 RepID=UPI00045F4AAE|nr:HAD-IIB family hydrolase [Geomicrobium sp. JCM 19039]GAK12337.1 hydrolase [Geomicrobium sp. JCM 19039]
MKTNVKRYPLLAPVEHIIYSDLDETYYCHTHHPAKALHAFEDFLAKRQNVLFGLVTGSSIMSALQKLESGHHYMPHFIASDLGTEIYWINESGILERDEQWLKHIHDSTFNDRVAKFVEETDVSLHSQTQHSPSSYKRNYYYYMIDEENDRKNLASLSQLATSNHLNLNMNRCNPLAGDPEHAYDIDFTPLGTGKKAVVHFINQMFSIEFEHTLAFGDSGNDLEMVKAVRHGYLLANATDEAKRRHENITEHRYTKGMLGVLQDYFSD